MKQAESRRPSPNPAPHGLWSLWDMLTLDADEFLGMIEFLTANQESLKGLKGTLAANDIKNARAGINEAIIRLSKLDLPVSIAAARHLLAAMAAKNVPTVVKNYPDLHRGFQQLAVTMRLELEGRKFYRPVRQFEKYYDQPKLFGEEVFTKFPSANNDIVEAGTCLALERGTASVMHLMRIIEVGIKVLAGALDIGVQPDWGSYLREIDDTLEARIKASGKRSTDEQFYAEVRITIDGVRMAWRNPTMHIENSYSPERAEDILGSVRTLMRHLATKLSE